MSRAKVWRNRRVMRGVILKRRRGRWKGGMAILSKIRKREKLGKP